MHLNETLENASSQHNEDLVGHKELVTARLMADAKLEKDQMKRDFAKEMQKMNDFLA